MHTADRTELILRPPAREEAFRVLDFYEANRREFLLPRPDTDFAGAVERGQHFVIENDGEIVAASGVFEYGEHLRYVEASETLVLPEVQGFGLQALLFRVRIASIVLTQGPAIGITTAVDPDNTRSVQTTRKQGFELWTTPIEQAFESCPTCPHAVQSRPCCCDFYLLPVDKAREAVTQLLQESATGAIVLHNKANDELRIDCRGCRILGDPEFRSMLEEFAAGSTWD